MTMTTVTVACAQLAPVVGDLDGNRRRAREAIRAAVAAGARLVVLPELCTSGYVFASLEEARSLAGDEALADWAEEARAGDAVVVGGFCEQGPGGVLHNAAAVVDGTGVRAVHRKAHLWDRERLVFAAGAAPAPVVDTAVGRIGVAVCYDASFPEVVRGLALRGAEVIAVPANNPAADLVPGQEPLEIAMVRAQAYFSRVFVACCDRYGAERGVEFLGASLITDEQGWALTAPALGAPALLTAEIAPERARDKRWNERNDAFADRRPELYAADPVASV